MLGRVKPIITLCIQQGLLSHFSVYYLQVARWFWETLHYAIRLFFLEGSSTTTDCLLDLTEETTTTLDKGDTDKKLIAFVWCWLLYWSRSNQEYMQASWVVKVVQKGLKNWKSNSPLYMDLCECMKHSTAPHYYLAERQKLVFTSV